MNPRNRNYPSKDASLPLSVVEAQFQSIADTWVPLSAACAAALPESLVTWRRLRELLTDRSVPFELMEVDVDAVWVWLIERARRQGEPAVLACAGVAVPMMAATAARLANRSGGDRADAEAAVLAAFVAAVGRLNLEQAHPWCALRWAAFNGGRAWEKAEVTAPTPIASDPGANIGLPQGNSELLLVQAIAEGVIDQAGAESIAATRLARRTVAAVAAERGVPYKTLHQRRFRAERRLRRWLRARLTEFDPDRTSVVEADALDAVARATAAVERLGERRIVRVVSNSGPSQAGTKCAEKSAVSAHPTPAEAKRCA
ncbi:hypothetical protein GZH49_12600 [Nocardia terpenica]|uniref:hypothetical protein n=1 Tax=Nocardia terpenica TaxID=455432 RepID=UPI002FE1844B